MEKSKVKLLPHVLIRLGGMSYDVLKDLEFSENILEQIETFEKLEQQFIQNQIDLIEYLKEYSMDYIHFSLIRKLKKVIRKGQLVKVTLFEVLSEVLINKVLIYNNLLSNRITNKVALEYSFEVRYLKIQEQLQIISQNDNLQKALPLSSLTFSKQYLKYLDKTPKQFRKKEQQIQQKLMQFLTRTATKASPFSSFTPVCYGTLGQLNDNRFFDTTSINLNLKRQIEWNNYLLEIFKSAFINHDDILPFFKVYLNATIKSNEFEYEFLINQQNIEKFQKLEKQPILEIFETMVSSDNGIQIKVLIDQLRVEIEAEESDLLTFFREFHLKY